MMSHKKQTEPSAVAPGQTHRRVVVVEFDPALPRSVLFVPFCG